MKTGTMKMLIIDDEKITIDNLQYLFKKENYEVFTALDSSQALQMIENIDFDIVLTDLKMKQYDGLEILKRCKKKSPWTEVIIITAFAAAESAVTAMKNGAFYYISKPFKFEALKKIISEAGEKILLKRENRTLKEKIKNLSSENRFLTIDGKMQKTLELAKQAAGSDGNIIISGESGTGKELFARFIYLHSKRAGQPFSAVNCGAFNEELLANELFGHEKGAYTGAGEQNRGIIESCGEGTLLLDEFTEMSKSMQVKLLRVLQEGEIFRLGSAKPVKINVRFFAATNRDIDEAVREKALRPDLFYRLNVFHFHLPPLRERKNDIVFLFSHFIKKYTEKDNKRFGGIEKEALDLLLSYSFPGNIRELENIAIRASAVAREEKILAADLPDEVKKNKNKIIPDTSVFEPVSLEEQEKIFIRKILDYTGNNKNQAARLLKIDRTSLWRKIRNYGL